MSKHRGVSLMPHTEEYIDPVADIHNLGGFISRAYIRSVFEQIMADLESLDHK